MITFFRAALISLCACALSAAAQPTIGLLQHDPHTLDSGYVLFAPLGYTETYLVDMCGEVAHTWHSDDPPALAAYLLPDGSILRAASAPPNDSIRMATILTQRIAWDGTLLWSYRYTTSMYGQHHDIEFLPNGDVMIIVQDFLSNADAYAAGRDTSMPSPGFISDKIVELRPVGADSAEVVWQWRAVDHLVQQFDATRANYGAVANHSELIDINYPARVLDWLHVNSVRYNAERDEVMISAHNFGELWIIDHGTTTAEAASHSGGARNHGGDLLYRWGNPAAYNKGGPEKQDLFGPHDAHWIADGLPDAGKIMVLNNGVGRPGSLYSTVEILSPPLDNSGNYNASPLPYLPASPSWIYPATPDLNFYCSGLGGSQMLSNHNVLVCNGNDGDIFEIDSTGTIVWNYVMPVSQAGPMTQGTVPHAGDNQLFKAIYYPFSYPGVSRARVGGPPIELDPTPTACELSIDTGSSAVAARPPNFPGAPVMVYPNPANTSISVESDGAVDQLKLYNAVGELVAEARDTRVLNTGSRPDGVYCLAARRAGHVWTRMVTILH